MSFDWENFRRTNGTLDLESAFRTFNMPAFQSRELPPIVLDFFHMIETAHPLTSRQAAALALAQAMLLMRGAV